MNIFSVLLIIVGLLVVAIVTYVITHMILMFTSNEFTENLKNESPVREIFAIIISKRHEQSTETGISGLISTNHFYYITVSFPNGSRHTLSVNSQQYDMLFERDQGILYFKQFNDEILFVNFSPTPIDQNWRCVGCRAVNESTHTQCIYCRKLKLIQS